MGIFEREQISRSIINLEWTKHIEMGSQKESIGHQKDISALDIDEGDQMIIMASHCGQVSVANYKYLGREKWKKPMTLKLEHNALQTIKWCPLDLRLFMVTTKSNWMRVCDSTMEKVINGAQFEGDVYFHWNEHNMTNSKVAVADGSRSMKIVDFRVGLSLPQNIRWDDVPIDVVQWFPSRHHYLYAGRRDGKIGIFDVRSTRGVLAEKTIHTAPIFGIRVSKDGRRLITADRSGRIHVADTWNFQTKFQYRDEFDLHPRRRPVFEILSGKDLFVATNFHRLTVVKFDESRRIKVTESVEIAPRVLKNKPIVFRESSYELIAGHTFNYLNVLSLAKSREYVDEEEEASGLL
ncbi:hypothetical protein GCK72_004719 [Caenorhabditis remanei]|uniref:Uncharacterized protein n=1 Tax=Caenorhabditis remanei TaxID=31234 RepID=A0A6A5HCN1_CAERE|nr:hypothetical protein GCK72_004719 [Caenorhabditis remanei]KAF1764769.1 hypothetical protein GCK72_004719 [Caenorhabditis remanei]